MFLRNPPIIVPSHYYGLIKSTGKQIRRGLDTDDLWPEGRDLLVIVLKSR